MSSINGSPNFDKKNLEIQDNDGSMRPLEGAMPPSSKDSAGDARTSRIALSVRPLNLSEVDLAVSLFSGSPGWETYAEAFRSDAITFLESPPSNVLGAFLPNGAIVGVGCAVKELFDFAYWSISWVMVDESLRGQGIGGEVMRGLESYVLEAQNKFANPNCRVLLSAIDADAERFYSHLGYKTLLSGPLESAGECLMYRDVRGPGLPLKSPF